MNRYLAETRRLAEETPPARNRIIDLWRTVAIGVVVVGHWLAASIWLRPDGEMALLNSLQWIPYAGWVTWLVQVMPVFFLVGGYANARALRPVVAGEQRRREWITIRARRLFTPVLPLLLVWVVLIIVMRPFVPADGVYAAAMSATVPLWFLAVYITLTAVAPMTHRWWLRSGPLSVGALVAAAVTIDVARFAFDVPGIGWLNFLFVWAAVHQVGYWWADRDARGGGVPPSVGWLVAGAALGLLVTVTWAGWYPVAMIGIPGAETTNMTPPTFAIGILGAVQTGVIWGTQPAVRRLTARLGVWHAVVAISGVIMTVYIWHLSAMSLVAGIGLFTFDGAVFKVEPGTTTWWLTRPVWVAALGLVTAGLVLVFARYERRISQAPPPRQRPVVLVGILLCAGSAAAVAWWGLATPNAVVNWIIPACAFAGAALLGALPARRTR